MQKILVLLLALTLGQWAQAQESQDYYTIQLGNFIQPSPQDFAAIQPLGFIYSRPGTANLTQLFLGGFDKKQAAQQVLNLVKSKGYADAFLSRKNMAESVNIAVIQIGTFDVAEDIDWEKFSKAGKLYAILNEGKVKLIAGKYATTEIAKSYLPAIQARGFKDAFIKVVNDYYCHELHTYDTKGFEYVEEEVQQSYEPIPDSYEDMTAKGIEEEVPPAAEAIPDSYGTEKTPPPAQPIPDSYGSEKAPPPAEPIPDSYEFTEKSGAASANNATAKRSMAKRTSVLKLQTELKLEKAYAGSLDGIYGKGTSLAVEKIRSENQQLKKYLLLTDKVETPVAHTSDLQNAINNLWNDEAAAIKTLKFSDEPIAKAYRAYYLKVKSGSQDDINRLMNEAIKDAFVGKKIANQPPFDFNSSYNYTDVSQLILHLRYVQDAATEEPAAPCWLFEQETDATRVAFEPDGTFTSLNYPVQQCDNFMDWQELKLLQLIAEDINTTTLDPASVAASNNRRARHYLALVALSPEENKLYLDWNHSLWVGIDRWAERDPLHQKISKALKIAYYQGQIRLEDYFMNKGFTKKEATGMALSTLYTIVGPSLESYSN